MGETLELLFGVKGGDAITPGTSGGQIKADIDSIVQQLHTGGDLALKFTADQASLTALRDELKRAASGIEVTFVKGANTGGGSPSTGKDNTDKELQSIQDLISGTQELYRLRRDAAKYKNADAAPAYNDAADKLARDLERQAKAANLTAKQIQALQGVQRRGEVELAAEKLRTGKAVSDAQTREEERNKASIAQVAQLRSQYRNLTREIESARAAGIADPNKPSELNDLEELANSALKVGNDIGPKIDLTPLIEETNMATIKLDGLNRVNLDQAIGTISAVRARVKVLKDETVGQQNAVAAVTNSYAKLANRVQDYMARIQGGLARDPVHSQKLQQMVEQIRLGPKGAYKSVLQASAAFQKLQGEIKGAGLESEKLWQSVKRIVKQKFGYGVLAAAALMARRQLIQVYQSVADIDAKLTELQIVSGESGDTMAYYMDKAAASAKRVSASITDIIDATTVYRRLGFSLSNSLDFAELTTMYSKVGGVDISDAEANITAIIKAFDLEDADKLRLAMDKVVMVGNNFAISASQIGSGLNRASAALVAAGNTFDESLALLTAANTITQNAEISSTAMRTITARLTQSKTELENLGEEIDKAYSTTSKYREKLLAITGVDILEQNGKDYRSTYAILNDIAAMWENLDSIDQASVTNMIAGTRQVSVFNSLMQNWEEAQGVVEATAKASGAMSKAYEVYTDSIEGRLNVLKASAQELSTDLLDDDVVKGAVTGVTVLVNLLDKLLSTVGTLPIVLGGIGIAGLIRSVGTLKTELIAANAVIANVTGVQSAVQWLSKYDDAIIRIALSQTALGQADRNRVLATIAAVKAQHLILETSKEQILTDAASIGIDRKKLQGILANTFAVNNEANGIKTCTAAELEHALIVAGVPPEKAKEIAARNANAVAAAKEGQSIAGVGDLAKAAWSKIAGFFKSGAGMVTLAGAAIYTVVRLYRSYIENIRKEAKEAKEALSSLTSEVSGLETELEGIKKRIAEINALDTPTLADMDELAKLREQNDELERELRIKKALQKQTAVEAEDAAFKALATKQYKVKETGVIVSRNPAAYEHSVEWDEYLDQKMVEYRSAKAAVEDATAELDRLIATGADAGAIDNARQRVSSAKDFLQSIANELSDEYAYLKETMADAIGDTADTDAAKAWLEKWERFLAEYDILLNGLTLDDIDLTQHADAIAALKQAFNGGGDIDWEGLYQGNDAVRKLIDLLIELGVIGAPTAAGIREIAEALNSMGASAANAHARLLPEPESFFSLYGRVTDAIGMLTGAQGKLNDKQHLTNEEVAKLLDAYPDLISYYDTETGQLKVTVGALQDKINAAIAGEKAALETSKKTVEGYLEEAKAAYAAAEAAVVLARAKGASAVKQATQGDSASNGRALYQSAQSYFKEYEKVLGKDQRLYAEYRKFLASAEKHQHSANFLKEDLNTFRLLQGMVEGSIKNTATDRFDQAASHYESMLDTIEAQMAMLDQLGKSGSGSSISSSAAKEVKDAFEELKEQLDDWFGDMEFKVSLRVDAGDADGAAKLYEEMIRRANKALDTAYASGKTVDDDWVQDLTKRINDYKKALSDLRLEEYDKLIAYNDDFDVWNKVSYSKLDVLADKLKKINQLYLAGYLSYKDWYDYYTDAAKDAYDIQKDALEELLETTMDAIKEQNDAQAEALENQSDAYQKLIDQKKKLLEDTKDQSDYEREVAKRVKEIAKLQERITQLALDDSREAAAERRKLEEELTEKQESLADYQAEYGTDAAIEALDQQGEAFENSIKNRIDAVKAEVENEAELRRRAIALIDSSYQQMISNVRGYFESLGVVIDDELLGKLEQGLSLVGQFGSYSGAASGIGSSSLLPQQQIPDYVEQMKRNSQSWHTANAQGNKAEMDRLVQENERIAQMLKTIFGLDVWKNAAQGKWYIRMGGREMALFDAYHSGGVVSGYSTKNNKEVMALLERGEVVMDNGKQESFITMIKRAAQVMRDQMAYNFSQAASLLPGPPMEGAGTLSGFSPTFQFTFNHSGPMTEEDAKHYGQVAADTALDKLWTTLQKRGIT